MAFYIESNHSQAHPAASEQRRHFVKLKGELSYKIALQQSFLPRSGLGIKPGVSNPRLCRLLSCPEGTPENLAFYQRELLFPSEFFLIDTD